MRLQRVESSNLPSEASAMDGDGEGVKSEKENVKRSHGSRISEESGLRKTRSMSHDYASTHEIIEGCKSGKLPDQIMFNFHPQRWTDNPVLWARELVVQNVKNVVKAGLVKFRS